MEIAHIWKEEEAAATAAIAAVLLPRSAAQHSPALLAAMEAIDDGGVQQPAPVTARSVSMFARDLLACLDRM